MPAKLTRIQHTDPVVNRIQDDIHSKINPALVDGAQPTGDWNDLKLSQQWANAGSSDYANASYRVQADGSLMLRGVIKSAKPVTGDDAIASLPDALACANTRLLPLVQATITDDSTSYTVAAMLKITAAKGGASELRLMGFVGLTIGSTLQVTVNSLSIEAVFRG